MEISRWRIWSDGEERGDELVREARLSTLDADEGIPMRRVLVDGCRDERCKLVRLTMRMTVFVRRNQNLAEATAGGNAPSRALIWFGQWPMTFLAAFSTSLLASRFILLLLLAPLNWSSGLGYSQHSTSRNPSNDIESRFSSGESFLVL
jgi:hypothetical protein